MYFEAPRQPLTFEQMQIIRSGLRELGKNPDFTFKVTSFNKERGPQIDLTRGDEKKFFEALGEITGGYTVCSSVPPEHQTGWPEKITL